MGNVHLETVGGRRLWVEFCHGRREEALQEAHIELQAMFIIDGDLGRSKQVHDALGELRDLKMLAHREVRCKLGLQQL